MRESVVVIYSDLSKESNADEVEFGLDGVTYTIDLTETEAKELREFLGRYIEAGTRTGGRRKNGTAALAPNSQTAKNGTPRKNAQPRKKPSGKSSRKKKATVPESVKIRSWAAENGLDVSPRGRVPASVRDAYAAAQ